MSFLNKVEAYTKYIRIGKPPAKYESRDWHREQKLVGMSVYEISEIHPGELYELYTPRGSDPSFDGLIEDIMDGSRKCYLVDGKEVGTGPDGEPLIKRVKVIKELPFMSYNDDANALGESWWWQELDRLKKSGDEEKVEEHYDKKHTFPNWQDKVV